MYFFYDDLFLEHNPGAGHPENAGRLVAIMGRLQSQSWFGQLRGLSVRLAVDSEIKLNHSSQLIQALEQEMKEVKKKVMI